MPAEHRAAEEIRREIAGEREQLVTALDELRRSVHERRRAAGAVAAAAATGVAVAAAVAVARRFGRS